MRKVLDLQRRSQSERLIIAETLLSAVWDEISEGKIEDDIIQIAINCQVSVNRIMWKLNALLNHERRTYE